MSGIEQQVLKIVKELELADAEALSRKMAVTPEYVTTVCTALVTDGYLIKTPKGYILTPEGKKAVDPVKSRGPIAVLKGG